MYRNNALAHQMVCVLEFREIVLYCTSCSGHYSCSLHLVMSRQTLTRAFFVATKIILMAAPANDTIGPLYTGNLYLNK